MKKLLVLLALLLALTMVFVACQNTEQPDDTTVADQPTEEPTQDVEDPTAEPTDPEETTEEPTEAPTAEPDDPTEAPTTAKPEDPTEPPATQEPETADPMEPVNVFGAEDIQTVTGGDPSNMTQDCLTLEDGFIHVVPIGPDPYWYPFAGVDGARYVAIRYRTDATGADIQMYIGSTGGGPSDDSTMLRQPVIADSEWHVAIFDTQSLIEAGKYDGEYVSYFRFDALEAGYILDENGQPYKPDGVNYARYTLPEGCSIDVAYIGFFHNEEAIAKYDFEQYPPFSQITDAGMKNHSFDTFYVNGQMYFPDGGADAKLDEINNTLTFASAAELENITLRGWIGFDQAIDSFGYYVDNYEFVYGEFKTATEDGVLAAGGEFASRFEIKVPLEYLEGDDHFVGFVVKLADGTVAQLREEIVIDLPELPKDITDSFTADVNSNEVGTTMDASDLANFFVTELPLAGSGVEANGEGKLYHLTSINDMYADVNGKYFFKANVINSDGAGWMFVRGYRVVNSDEIIEKFDPAGGFFKINNYYETDMAGAMGGAGIYARVSGGKLFIMVKYYNTETVTRVGNKIYAIDAAGSELTMADNGSTVSILVDGVTYATIALSGSVDYADINEIDPAGSFAAQAVITLKDGTTETIENTLIAATCQCQVGIVARAGSFKFDALSVGGYSAIEVPALEIVAPEEPEPVDPDAPVLVLDPEYINELAGSTEQTVAQHIGSHEIITEDGVTFVRLTSNGGDPYVAIVKLGSYLELPPYMAFAYRTNCDLGAHIFIGSGSGWTGNGDVTSVDWNQDNNWNLAVLDLNNAGLTSIQNGIVSYCRFDFFTGNGAGNMDVEYVAFFNSAEAAEKYFNNLHPVETPTEPETEEPETEEPEINKPETPEEIVNAAYGLAEGETLEGTYTLTGVITSIDTAYNANYGNISVWMQIGDMADKPILAFRLAGEGAETLKAGDTITVTGSLTNYYSKIEFAQGCTLDAVVPGEETEPEEPSANEITIDFSDTANRTEFSASIQVWGNGDFILTNNKAASTNDVADYTNPARFYAHSEIVISGVSMTKLVFACDASKYVTALNNSLADLSGITITTEGMNVIVEFDTPVDSFIIPDLTAQVRLDVLTVIVAAAEEPETPDEPAANEIKVTTTDTYGWFDEYTFVADAAGNYTFTLPAGLGMWSAEAFSTWAEPELDYNMITEGGDVTVTLAAGEEFKFLVGAYTKDEWTITYTFAEGEVGGDEPETPVEPEIPALILGENTIVVSDALYNEGGFITSITVTEEGTYTFASSNLLIRVMTDMGMSIGSAYLTPGTYEVQIVTAYLSGPCTTSVTVEFTAPEEPDEPTEPEIPDYPAIETLPFTYDVTADGLDMDGVYFIYTADNEITLVISKPDGSFVSPTATNDWSEDENGNYVLTVNAGETIVLNFWAMETIYEGSFTVTASATAPEGSSENPIVLSDININPSFKVAHDVYYTYTASVAPIKIELHYAEGCTIEVTGSFEGDMDPGAMQYNIVIIEAGQSIVIHISGEGAGNYAFVSSGKK